MRTVLVAMLVAAVAVVNGDNNNGSAPAPTLIGIQTNTARANAPTDGLAAFHKANIEYIGTNYVAAASLYQAAIDAGFRAGGVYYNLGNAWYRCGRLGKAIAAYRHAQWLLPRDSDVAENLATARLQQGAEAPGASERSGAVRAFLFVYYYVSPDETVWGFCFCLAAFFAVLSWQWFSPAQWLRRTMLVLGACALVLGIAGGTHVYWAHAGSEAVVVGDSVAGRSGASESATGIFVLNDGAEVGVTGREGGWVKIKVADKNGWVPEHAVEVL